MSDDDELIVGDYAFYRSVYGGWDLEGAHDERIELEPSGQALVVEILRLRAWLREIDVAPMAVSAWVEAGWSVDQIAEEIASGATKALTGEAAPTLDASDGG